MSGAGEDEESSPDTPTGDGTRHHKPRKERRLARHARHARMVWENPWSSTTLLRDAMLRIWRTRGGGLYGLGYLVAFVLMEVRLVIGEFSASSGLFDFLGNQIVEYLFRVGFMSLVNVLLAFLWPLLLLEHLGGWGLVLLPLAFVVFERWLRPGVEARFPELRKPKKRAKGAAQEGAPEACDSDADTRAEPRDS